MRKPDRFAIQSDEYHAKSVGQTADGTQFFLTTPFFPEVSGEAGRACIALYFFEKDGRFREALIDDLNLKTTLDRQSAQQILEKRLADLGPVTFCRIEIEPFQIEFFGIPFGLIAHVPKDKEDVLCIEAQPGNFMAFFEPWDSGEYDT